MSVRAKRFKAVVFDLFGTLARDFDGLLYDEMCNALADALGAPREAFRRRFDATWAARKDGSFPTVMDNLEAICEELGIEPERRRLLEAQGQRVRATLKAMERRPEAVSVLSKLKEDGYKLGLLSDASGEVPALWRATELAPLVDAAVFSSELGHRKPHPRMFEAVCHELGVEPEACLYVGDGGGDELRGASRAGMTAVRILPVIKWYHELKVDWSGPVIERLTDVFGFLSEREGQRSNPAAGAPPHPSPA